MRRMLRTMAATSLLLLAGCMTAATIKGPPEATPTGSLERGMTRAEAEAILGRPDGRRGNVSFYNYNLGVDRTKPSLVFLPFMMLGDLVYLGAQPFVGSMMYLEWRDQRGQLGLLYGPDDRVLGLSFTAAEIAYRGWRIADDPEANLPLLCEAAEAGHGAAAHSEAGRRLYGVYGAEPDVEAAFRWALMARFTGHPDGAALVQRIAPLLAADLRSRAESRFAAGELPACLADARAQLDGVLDIAQAPSQLRAFLADRGSAA
jgi:hypothetical protein